MFMKLNLQPRELIGAHFRPGVMSLGGISDCTKGDDAQLKFQRNMYTKKTMQSNLYSVDIYLTFAYLGVTMRAISLQIDHSPLNTLRSIMGR